MRPQGGNPKVIARISLNGSNLNLPSTCLPRFSQLAQVIEVKKPAFTLPSRVSSNIKDFLGSYCIIENARPELFIRRDFISKFVDKGTIFVAQLSDHQGAAAATSTNYAPTPATGATTMSSSPPPPAATACGYSLTTTKNNVMIITMNSKQYHRFGLLATKVISPLQPSKRHCRGGGSKRADDKLYRIEIDLKDKRIMNNNKFQDKLMQTLRRLNSINRIYFRFIPDNSKLNLSIAAAQELSLEYFNYVINEYSLDGCKPVPLTRCSIGRQTVLRNWVNYSQLHPSFELSKLIAGDVSERALFQSQLDHGRDDEKFDEIMSDMIELVDWLGYQLLSLDCDKLAEMNNWNETTSTLTKQRYDVSCTQLIGTIDYEHVQDKLDKLFVVDGDDVENDSGVMFRALILYEFSDEKELLLCQDHGDSLKTIPDTDGHKMDVGEHSWPKFALKGGNDCLCGTDRGVVYLQDCSNGPKAAREITVIGLSNVGI